MLSAKELVACEENFPFWKTLSEQGKQTLLNGTISFTHPPGAIVHEDRNKCTGLLMLISGQLRIYIVNEQGKQITLYRLFDRDVCVLSASCLIRNITFDVHVSSEKTSYMLRIATDAYQSAGKNNPQLLDFTNQLVSSRFSDVMWVVEQVVFMKFDQRLALHLLERSAIEQSDTFKATHEAIARDLGSAREVVTRMLSRFAEENLVSLSRGGITLVDRRRLTELT
ncbi:MAG: Crp/Fnr family transcriptional regulator [Sphaerochaetaceae bacterium]